MPWFDFFLNSIDGQMVDYLEEYCEDILMARFEKPEYLKKKLSLYQMYLEAINQDATDWTSKYHAEHCIRQIQTLMIQLKQPQAELDAFNKMQKLDFCPACQYDPEFGLTNVFLKA